MPLPVSSRLEFYYYDDGVEEFSVLSGFHPPLSNEVSTLTFTTNPVF